METVELKTVVVGGGVLGLACARTLQAAGQHVTLLEASNRLGEGISSRISEVIHAGLYYPPGSKKAQHCLKGRCLLYDYLERRKLPFHRKGKLVIAPGPEETPALEALKTNAEAAGCGGLEWVSQTWLKVNEPGIRAAAALLSRHTGWLDVAEFLLALEADFLNAGGDLVLNARVNSIQQTGSGFELISTDQNVKIHCEALVLAAGLGTDQLLANAPDALRRKTPQQVWAKGSYFALSGPSPFQHHIYPLPEPGGLGVHATLSGDGRVKFGPDVEWIDHKEEPAISYDVDAWRKAAFMAAVSRYWPGVTERTLTPDYAGVRPKLSGPDGGFADFCILGPDDHGLPELVCLTGIESPGLTAALSIADEVAGMLRPA